jgi:hypothetical protein
MARVVVVSSSEIDVRMLGAELHEEDELIVVVPAVRQSRLDWLTNDEGDARRIAQQVGERIATEAPPDEASIEVKPDPPSQAVLDAIVEHDPDRILLALRADEDASWLEGDLHQALAALEGVPVARVIIPASA